MQGIKGDIIKCLVPLGLILVAFSSLRFVSNELIEHVHYMAMPYADRLLTGGLPTAYLQKLLWHGHVQWYDFVFYGVYVMHYVLVVLMAVLIFKFRRSDHQYFGAVYILTSYVAFALYIMFPAAPPWLASQNDYIPHIARISTAVYSALGIHNYTSMYNSYAPDTIAAMPSLHAAYSVLFSLFAFREFGRKWGALSLLYPLLICVGVVYMGEHYLSDVIGGALLAGSCFLAAPKVLAYGRYVYKWAGLRLQPADEG